jgi:hypothetical protein
MSLTRKEFLSSIAGVVTGAAGVALVAGCSDSGSGSDAAGQNCLMNGTTTEIGGNHGHVLVVSKADVMAAVSKTYDITGGAGHTHSVTINATQFVSLQGNTTAMTVSTAGGSPSHTHDITVMCA